MRRREMLCFSPAQRLKLNNIAPVICASTCLPLHLRYDILHGEAGWCEAKGGITEALTLVPLGLRGPNQVAEVAEPRAGGEL